MHEKVQSEPHCVMQRTQGITKEYIPQSILITAARRSKRSHGVRKRRGSGKSQNSQIARTSGC
nr:Hypothetical protein [Raoultella ornithinolytica]